MCCECKKLEDLYRDELLKNTGLNCKNLDLENSLNTHKSVISDKDTELKQLKEQLAWLKKQIFGQKSEKHLYMKHLSVNSILMENSNKHNTLLFGWKRATPICLGLLITFLLRFQRKQ